MQDKRRPNTVTILAQCGSTKKHFTIRYIRLPSGEYAKDFAAPYIMGKSRKPALSTLDKLKVSFAPSLRTYKGCPHCKNIFWIHCNCGMYFCHDGADNVSLKCPKCGKHTDSFVTADSIRSGGLDN
jgi:hypothetical protein